MKGNHHEHGVIVDPVRGEEFVGSRGAGAQLNGKRIRVTTRAKLSECVLGTGIPPGSMNLLPDYSRTLETLTGTCRGIRRGGSAATSIAAIVPTNYAPCPPQGIRFEPLLLWPPAGKSVITVTCHSDSPQCLHFFPRCPPRSPQRCFVLDSFDVY